MPNYTMIRSEMRPVLAPITPPPLPGEPTARVNNTGIVWHLGSGANQKMGKARWSQPNLIWALGEYIALFNQAMAIVVGRRIEGCRCERCNGMTTEEGPYQLYSATFEFVVAGICFSKHTVHAMSGSIPNERLHRNAAIAHCKLMIAAHIAAHAPAMGPFLGDCAAVLDAVLVDLRDQYPTIEDAEQQEPLPLTASATFAQAGVPIAGAGKANRAWPECNNPQMVAAHSRWSSVFLNQCIQNRNLPSCFIVVTPHGTLTVPLVVPPSEEARLGSELGSAQIQARIIHHINRVLEGRIPDQPATSNSIEWVAYELFFNGSWATQSFIADAQCDICSCGYPSSQLRSHPHVSIGQPNPTTREGMVCHDCSSGDPLHCISCGTEFIGTHWTVRRAGDNPRDTHSVCGRCYAEHGYRRCDRCGEAWVPNRAARNTSRCPRCQAEEVVRRYSDDPDLRCEGEGPRFFGVELEVVCTTDKAQCAKKITTWWNGDAIVKHDGSLPNTGFEIVTRPADLRWHRERWLKFLITERKQSGAAELRSFGESSCGLHIHYSKNAISNIARGKLVAFINADENMQIIDMLAARGQNRYCERRSTIKPGMCNTVAGTGHYHAVNLSNAATDEVRIFKGTMNAKRVLLYLDFVDALMDFSSMETVGIVSSKNHNLFKEFVNARKEKWPYLHCYFEYGDVWLRRDIYNIETMLTLPSRELSQAAE